VGIDAYRAGPWAAPSDEVHQFLANEFSQ
jgi:hypothetical protein